MLSLSQHSELYLKRYSLENVGAVFKFLVHFRFSSIEDDTGILPDEGDLHVEPDCLLLAVNLGDGQHIQFYTNSNPRTRGSPQGAVRALNFKRPHCQRRFCDHSNKGNCSCLSFIRIHRFRVFKLFCYLPCCQLSLSLLLQKFVLLFDC